MWPFSSLNRVPYYLAIRSFVRRYGGFPEVKSIYLRHTLAKGGWVPGLSDIDLTVVISGDMDPEKEFIFLVSFWKAYEKLKGLFPMLGHVDVLDENYIKTWTQFTIPGYESKNWRHLYGEKTLGDNYAERPERLAADSLNHALGLYRKFFLRDAFRERRASAALKRLALKILRYIDYGGGIDEGLRKKIESYGIEDLFSHLIITLERRVTLLYRGSLRNGKTGGAQGAGTPPDPRKPNTGHKYRRALVSGQNTVETLLYVPRVASKPFIVLKDGLDAKAVKNFIKHVLKVSDAKKRPAIISASVFDYMFRVQDPFGYIELIKDAHLAYGRDLIAEMRPPDECSFIKNALDISGPVFTYPRRKKIISAPEGDKSINVYLKNEMLRKAMSVKLSLEKKEFVWHLDELLRKYEEYYPRYHKRIIKYKEKCPGRERFMLLKDLADDAHRSISGMDSGLRDKTLL